MAKGFIGSKEQQDLTIDDPYALAVFKAWNILDGQVRVEAVADVCDLIGWDDAESLLWGLVQLRDTKVR